MKLEEILKEWEKDSYIDETKLSQESLKIPSLHAKYYRFYLEEKMILKKLENEMKELKLLKHEFYMQGPNEETMKLGWKLPAKGLILKNEISQYIESDKDIIELNLKIALAREKVDLLESIIKTILSRNFSIKNAIDFLKWSNGDL